MNSENRLDLNAVDRIVSETAAPLPLKLAVSCF
jgi:hypothetical protein